MARIPITHIGSGDENNPRVGQLFFVIETNTLQIWSDGSFKEIATAGMSTKEVDLFCMSGQSNMQGQTEGPITYQVSPNTAFEYRLLTHELKPVEHPFGEDIGSLLLGAHQGYGNCAIKFAETYYRKTNRIPIMVSASKGATTILQWLKNGPEPARYAKVVEKVTGCYNKLESIGFSAINKFFVWLQGESDGISETTKDLYKSRFLTLWNDLKNDCFFNTAFFLRVAKFYSYPVLPIIQAQEELAEENEDIVMATRITGTFDPSNEYMQDIWHYTNAGQDLLGFTAGRNIGQYVLGHEIELEEEPYDELLSPLEWNYRLGTDKEVRQKVIMTKYGTPTLENDYLLIDANEGYKFKGIDLAGDFTFSITALLTGTPAGYIFASNDHLIGFEPTAFFFFYYLGLNKMRLNIAGTNYDVDVPSSIGTNRGTYNHYVFQRDGELFKFYYNGVLQDSVAAPTTTMTINELLYSSVYSAIGKTKHIMIANDLIAPEDCDPTFYANNEQGTI